MIPTKEWIKKFEEKKHLLKPLSNLNSYFKEKSIDSVEIDTMNVGTVTISNGEVIVCDPLVYLNEEALPYFQKTPSGTFPVDVCVIKPFEGDSARYAAIKVSFTDKEAVTFEEALIGNEDIDEIEDEGSFFGFNVDAGLATIVDTKTRDAYIDFDEKWYKENGGEDGGKNIYDDYFAGIFKESYKVNPKYQREDGDWINFTIPNTNHNLQMIQSGFGDGGYPVYFGYDKEGKMCSLIVNLICIELAYSDDEDLDDDE